MTLPRRRLVQAAAALAGLGFSWPAVGAPLSPDKRAPGEPLSVSEQIARFLAQARFEDLPYPVVEKAKAQIVFFMGRALEGRDLEEGRQMRAALSRLDLGRAGCTVIGLPFTLRPSDAAFANCSLMRGSGRDDVLWPGGVHAGVLTLPPALAYAERNGMSGKDLILALVLGYEVLGKLSKVAEAWAGPFPRRPTNVYGAFGPATAAAVCMRLPEGQLAHVIGYAANLGFGVPEGGMAPHYYSLVNQSGAFAAEVVAAGGRAYSRTTVEGELGLYKSFFGQTPPGLSAQVTALGQDWEILKAEQKHHFGTGQNAIAFELLRGLIEEHDLKEGEIVKIDVFDPSAADAAPRKDAVASRGPFARPVEAYSSLPYALALLLKEGERIDPRWYDDNAPIALLNDADVARIMRKIQAHFVPAKPAARWAKLEVSLRDGRRLAAETSTFEVSFPATRWRTWLEENGKAVLPPGQLASLSDDLAELDRIASVRDLARKLKGDPSSELSTFRGSTVVRQGVQESASTQIARFLVGAQYGQLPAAVVEKAKAIIAYLIGLALAGHRNAEGEQLRRLLPGLQQAGGVTVMGHSSRLAPKDAAFANASLMRATWRDDVLFPSGVHAGILAVPAAFAIAEAGRLSGREVLLAVTLAYEVAGKLGSTGDTWSAPLPRRPSMVFGGFPPVVATALLLGCNAEQMANALGYAANLCMGVPEGGQMDHYYSLLARNGVLAAELARVGAAPYSDRTIEGDTGLYATFWGRTPGGLPNLIGSLGGEWAILSAEYKPFYGTGQSTVAVHLLLRLMAEHRLTAEALQAIEVALPSSEQGRQEHFHRGPFRNAGEAFSSLPFALAMASLHGAEIAGRQSDTKWRDQRVSRLAQKVEISFEAGRPERYVSIALRLADGRRLSSSDETYIAPFPRERWRGWLLDHGGDVLPAPHLRQLADRIETLDELPDVSTLLALCRPGGGRTGGRAG